MLAPTAHHERARELDPTLVLAQRNLAVLHARAGDWRACLPLLHAELQRSGEAWVQQQLSQSMSERNLDYAGALAMATAALRHGSAWYLQGEDTPGPLPINEPRRQLTNGTLVHDILQFEYLIARRLFGDELARVVDRYRTVLERHERAGETQSRYLEGEDLDAIGDVYNRILHVRWTPRVAHALSGSWDPAVVEDAYLSQKQGVVAVDDFLSPDALRELRAFCLESTVWLANRYAHGRLGALFHAGFNCPLVLQIAEELRAAMPRVIGDKHRIRQMWGFKNAPFQPGNSTMHADFAAVNVNFWITPDEANLEPTAGGLIVYDVDAPQHWDFHTYNGRPSVIRPFLDRQHAKAVMIPYRQNRAIIFNSDLFHCTDTVRFRPEYENRRINVTMLYGVRAEDGRRLNRPDPLTDPGFRAWRSAAFRGSRRRP
jgi:hypothetical protein